MGAGDDADDDVDVVATVPAFLTRGADEEEEARFFFNLDKVREGNDVV